MSSEPRAIRFGRQDYTYPSDELGPLRDSGGLVGDRGALLQRLHEDGYLYLPGYLNRDDVLAARARVLQYMADQEGLEPDSRPLDGVMGQYGKPVRLSGQRDITHCDEVDRILAGPRLHELHALIHDEPVITFDYKWLRAVGNEECTGAHMDHVYMGRGSQRLMTVWIPFGDIPIEQGTLCVCPGSHRLPEFETLRNTYGRMDVDRDRVEGWFTKNPREITQTFGGFWQTSHVKAGDVITFGMHLVHASTTNTTERWRLSCDVRYQPTADPADPRWIGESPPGHSPHQKVTPMAEARAAWGG